MSHLKSKIAVSKVIVQDDTGDSSPSSSNQKIKSRDEYKKQKELEEERKRGLAPAAIDEEGKDINPHIPEYISDAPWYLDPKGPTLKHQKVQPDRAKSFSSINQWVKKGVKEDSGPVTTKFRKGSCENCGAMTHKKRDCLERPRKVGAKFCNVKMARDDYIPDRDKLLLSFEGKRDRWNGYDPSAQQEVIDEYEKMEEMRKEIKKQKLQEALLTKSESGVAKNDPTIPDDDDGAPNSSDDDEFKYVDQMDMPGTKMDAAERYTVRNLRIREDTAKYLRNLDPNSAYYDPKTRAMRKNPYENTGREEVEFMGDNANRISGDTISHAQSQMFAWEAGGKGLDVHALAEPTKLESLKKQYLEKKDQFKDEHKQSIISKYGGEEYLKNKPPRELIFAQTEDYVEYDARGRVVKGQDAPKAISRYEEDIFLNNHTTVWGSYWVDGEWGFKCCHSTIKKSYCTGETTKEDQVQLQITSSFTENEREEFVQSVESPPSKLAKEEIACGVSSKSRKSKKSKKNKLRRRKREEKKKKKKEKAAESSSSSSDTSSNSEEESCDEDARLMSEAMKRHDTEQKANASYMKVNERKRPYNSAYGGDSLVGGKSFNDEGKSVTQADMEVYYLKRERSDDPMANFKK